MKHTPLPKVLPKQVVTSERTKSHTLDVASLNVYKTKEEFDEAIKSGSFDIARTFHIDDKGRFYSLCYKPDVSMRSLSIQDKQDVQLEQTQKLDKMLRDQSNLP